MRGITGTVLVLLLLIASVNVRAAAITAASCSAADVQAALNKAAAGDTVHIPAGTCSWTSAVAWDAPANVTLIGAGDLSVIGGGDATVIVDGYVSTRPLFTITVNPSGTFRMAGLTFRSSAQSPAKENGMMVLTGPGNVRIDHTHFDTHAGRATVKPLWIGDRVYGVLDHNLMDFYGNSSIYPANGGGTDGKGNQTWASPTNFGGSDFIFFEDNIYRATVDGPCRIGDSFTAARVVWRFNTIQGCSGLEVHATGHAGDDRGARASEGYGNSFRVLPNQLTPPYTMADVSSGTMLLWGNTTEPQNLKNIFIFNVTRKNGDTYGRAAGTPTDLGHCGTAYTGTGSNWDGNTNTLTGYPCLDQPGRGQGDLLTGSLPNKVNSTTGTIAWPKQALEPIYFWKNVGTTHTGYGGGGMYSDNSGGRVLANRDYYPQASGIQTTSSSPFNGTSGTGWGTLANRPITCTAGVGYFATDQGSWNRSTANPVGVQQNGADGVLYKCTATNTWTLYYTPYTYPHPLTQTGPVMGPTAPANVRIVPGL